MGGPVYCTGNLRLPKPPTNSTASVLQHILDSRQRCRVDASDLREAGVTLFVCVDRSDLDHGQYPMSAGLAPPLAGLGGPGSGVPTPKGPTPRARSGRGAPMAKGPTPRARSGSAEVSSISGP